VDTLSGHRIVARDDVSGRRPRKPRRPTPLITVAKGITSAYGPMGAVLVADDVAEPLYAAGRTLLHGVTFGGHPLSAALALRNIEIFERDGMQGCSVLRVNAAGLIATVDEFWNQASIVPQLGTASAATNDSA
jgi:adenosylmethionine-8-amino-7-oxononanoate aminotransferase